MLTLVIDATPTAEAVELTLEHSLLSISKWEAIHEKAFFGREPKTEAETVSYIEQMVVDGFPPEDLATRLSGAHVMAIDRYMSSKQTATWFAEDRSARQSSEVVTNELVYHWMIDFGIPFDPCERWHFNRLITLIRVRGIKQTKPKKMSRQEQAERFRQVNEQRRRELGTTG